MDTFLLWNWHYTDEDEGGGVYIGEALKRDVGFLVKAHRAFCHKVGSSEGL
jgi:hypothetical protein